MNTSAHVGTTGPSGCRAPCCLLSSQSWRSHSGTVGLGSIGMSTTSTSSRSLPPHNPIVSRRINEATSSPRNACNRRRHPPQPGLIGPSSGQERLPLPQPQVSITLPVSAVSSTSTSTSTSASASTSRRRPVACAQNSKQDQGASPTPLFPPLFLSLPLPSPAAGELTPWKKALVLHQQVTRPVSPCAPVGGLRPESTLN